MGIVEIVVGIFFLMIGLTAGLMFRKNYQNIMEEDKPEFFESENFGSPWYKLFYVGSPFLAALAGLLMILRGIFH